MNNNIRTSLIAAIVLVLCSVVAICIVAEFVANYLGWSIFVLWANPIESLATILLSLVAFLLMFLTLGIVLDEGKRKYHDQDLE